MLARLSQRAAKRQIAIPRLIQGGSDDHTNPHALNCYLSRVFNTLGPEEACVRTFSIKAIKSEENNRVSSMRSTCHFP